jgi:hypothetical protein
MSATRWILLSGTFPNTKEERMARILLSASFTLAVLLTGCAELDVYPVNEHGAKIEPEGIPYYLPMPILIVGADFSCRIEYIPDLTQKYIIQATNAGAFERTVTLTQGWQFVGLTETGKDALTDIIDSLTKAVSEGVSFFATGGGGGEERVFEKGNLTPGVYSFEFSSGTLKLKPILNLP